MIVGLVYNLKGSLPNSSHWCRDLEAEYQDEEEVEALAAAIRADGFETLLFPCDPELPRELQQHPTRMAFNVAEGWDGRGRELFVPALLDMLAVPYTGSDALTLGVSLEKALCRMVAGTHGIG